jgi:2-oxoglutarate ferredoxin oxidoreductase subunit alpha
MKALPAVLTGDHFIKGDDACAEGAIAAGCKFYGGYPITPSTEIAERMSWRLAHVGGQYIQMEDEMGSMAAVVGASCAGAKAMTATSGPGFSLMMENIGLAVMMEAPCVIVNIQRGGPSTGLPTLTSQSDMMQSRWGSHGDYEIVAYCPSTVQEMFDFAIKAFNTAERYRIPVMLMGDQSIGHMTAKLTIPPEEEIERVDRETPAEPPSPEFLPFDSEHLIPPMPIAGEGYRIHVTGLTHDDRGYPKTDADGQDKLVKRLVEKIRSNREEIVEVEERELEDAEYAVVTYGSTARVARKAIQDARDAGIKVGLLRLITAWPFPEKIIQDLGGKVEHIIVPEVNMGQIVHPVKEFSDCPVTHVPSAGGRMMDPDLILSAIKGVAA